MANQGNVNYKLVVSGDSGCELWFTNKAGKWMPVLDNSTSLPVKLTAQEAYSAYNFMKSTERG